MKELARALSMPISIIALSILAAFILLGLYIKLIDLIVWLKERKRRKK